jgi:hypothetical protein
MFHGDWSLGVFCGELLLQIRYRQFQRALYIVKIVFHVFFRQVLSTHRDLFLIMLSQSDPRTSMSWMYTS